MSAQHLSPSPPACRQTPPDAPADPVLSVIIPFRNCRQHLAGCLGWLANSRGVSFEVIAVDDASTDDTAVVAEGHGARVLRLPANVGPAGARNAGAAVARGTYLLFLDSDVGVKPDTLKKVVAAFAAHPDVAAVFGSYDLTPRAQNILSQYRNLLHHFVHQAGNKYASTFWAGCGAVRAEVFRQMGGFDDSYGRPSIEDIAFGVSLRQAGHRIILDKTIQVNHFKRWTLMGMLRTDVRDRGIPWTRLILARGGMPNDLNVTVRERLGVVLTFALIASFLAGVWTWPWVLAVLAGFVLIVLAIDSWSLTRRVPTTARMAVTAAVFAAAAVSTYHYAWWSVLPYSLFLAVIAINHRLYASFAQERSLLFAAFVLPMHLLYYAYCGVSFGIGLVAHVSGRKAARVGSRTPVGV